MTIKDGSGNLLVSDVSPGQYVAVAGQLEPEEFPALNNGLFYRNSKRPAGYYRWFKHDINGR